MLSVIVSVSVSVLSFVYFFVTSDTLEYSDSQIGVWRDAIGFFKHGLVLFSYCSDF